MRTKILFTLTLCVLLAAIPSARAQTTSVTVLSSPSSVVLRSDGTASFDTTVLVTYTGLSQHEFLVVGLTYYGLILSPNGTAAAFPVYCLPAALTAGLFKPGIAACVVIPLFGSGTENVSFHSIIFKAVPKQYHFAVIAGVVSVTATTVTAIGNSNADFFVSVKNQVTLTITAPSQVAVTIDNIIQNSGSINIAVSPGKHSISVPPTISLALDSRLMFDHWSDGSTLATRTVDLEGDTNLTPIYVTQYELTLTDPAATGSGWYDQGLVAGISVSSSEPCEGILGLLGCTRNFQGWYEDGNLVSSISSTSVTMNTSHTLDTQWTTNMAEPLAIIALIVVAIGAIIAFAVKRSHNVQRRTRRRRRK